MQAPSERARHDPPLAQAAIVRPTYQRRPVPGLDVEVPFSGGKIQMQGPYFLTPLDQSVLLAVLAQAHRTGCPTTETKGVNFQGSTSPEHWCLETTVWAIGRDVYGHPPQGRSYQQLKQSLRRLGAVSVSAVDGSKWAQSWLLAVTGDDDSGQLKIILSWRLAKALAGTQYVSIDLEEHRELESDSAKILHAFFAASIRPGNDWRYHFETLSERVWGKDPVSNGTKRKRRQRLRNALYEINCLAGWSVEGIAGTGPITVRRRANGHAQTG